MPVYVALLRAINVGKGRTVRMTDLAALVGEHGGEHVTTYIQSGNVVFEHRVRKGSVLERDLGKAVSAMAGFHVPVVVRSRTDLSSLVEANPFDASDPTKLHVIFLDVAPTAEARAGVDAAAFAPEELHLRGKDLYLYLPGGMGRSKLAMAVGKLGSGTARNWRTVLALHERAAAI